MDDGPCIYFSDIYAHRYDEAGLLRAGFRVNSIKPAHNFGPAIVSGADGRFVIAWTRVHPDSARAVVARSYVGDHPSSTEVQVGCGRNATIAKVLLRALRS